MAVKKYDESSVQKLRGIEPVQRLPGMYTRTSDPTHIIQEAIDNAADEAFGEHADRIDVTLHRDGSVTVTDNGRGIPGRHASGGEDSDRSARLHRTSCRREVFEERGRCRVQIFRRAARRRRVGDQCACRDGSKSTVKRESALHRIVFEDGVVTREAEESQSRAARRIPARRCGSGPTRNISIRPKISLPDLERIVRSKAVLLPGVKVSLNIEGPKETDNRTWTYPEGMKGYLKELLADARAGRRNIRRRELCDRRRTVSRSAKARAGRSRSSTRPKATANRTRT